MPVFTPSFECRTKTARRQVCAALFGCVMLTACAQPAALPNRSAATPAEATSMKPASDATNAISHDISAITLERDCSGCPTGTRLELRRGGQAVATNTGKARLRTADSVARASLPVTEFEALVRQLMAAGFFELAEVYEEAGLQDGSWATLTVVRGGAARQVFRREDAGPASLKALESAIAALQARLVFVPDAR